MLLEVVSKRNMKFKRCMLKLMETTNLENKSQEITTGLAILAFKEVLEKLSITPLDLVKRNFLTVLNKQLCQNVRRKVSQKRLLLRKPSKTPKLFNLTC